MHRHTKKIWKYLEKLYGVKTINVGSWWSRLIYRTIIQLTRNSYIELGHLLLEKIDDYFLIARIGSRYYIIAPNKIKNTPEDLLICAHIFTHVTNFQQMVSNNKEYISVIGTYVTNYATRMTLEYRALCAENNICHYMGWRQRTKEECNNTYCPLSFFGNNDITHIFNEELYRLVPSNMVFYYENQIKKGK